MKTRDRVVEPPDREDQREFYDPLARWAYTGVLWFLVGICAVGGILALFPGLLAYC